MALEESECVSVKSIIWLNVISLSGPKVIPLSSTHCITTKVINDNFIKRLM
jgi:hypothetical protein